jgi:hypothetical protein
LFFVIFSEAARRQLVRDDIMHNEKSKILREAASICYKQHTQDHQWKCRDIYITYLKSIQHINKFDHDYDVNKIK